MSYPTDLMPLSLTIQFTRYPPCKHCLLKQLIVTFVSHKHSTLTCHLIMQVVTWEMSFSLRLFPDGRYLRINLIVLWRNRTQRQQGRAFEGHLRKMSMSLTPRWSNLESAFNRYRESALRLTNQASIAISLFKRFLGIP